jgi:uncharacterized protein YlxW (UPF0749 family)
VNDVPDSDPDPDAPDPAPAKGRTQVWRWLVPLVFGFAGLLFAMSAASAQGDDLRSDRITALTELVADEREDYENLQANAAQLEHEIDQLSGSIDDERVTELASQVEDLEAATGMVELRGPAVKVTLDDAPYDQPVPDGRTANDLVVHQQDLQAVVNALWEGGAEGITLEGQRIVATTAIKCVGNTVQLHGVPYSPPYEIVAVGDVSAMVMAVNDSEYIQNYKDYTEPPFNIGWEFETLQKATLAQFDSGLLDFEYAEVAED